MLLPGKSTTVLPTASTGGKIRLRPSLILQFQMLVNSLKKQKKSKQTL